MQILDVIGRQGGDPDAGVLQPPGDMRQMLQVPRQAVLVLDQQDVELAGLGRGDGLQQAGAVGHGGARNGGVLEMGDDPPALRLGVTGADRQLIGDRAFVLPL